MPAPAFFEAGFILAYTYNADVHCPGCAQRAFPRGVSAQGEPERVDWRGVPLRATDSEGNRVHRIRRGDSSPEYDEHCGDCGTLVRNGTVECSWCGATGHERENCPVMSEDDEPVYSDDEYFNAQCSCDSCTAPAYNAPADERCAMCNEPALTYATGLCVVCATYTASQASVA